MVTGLTALVVALALALLVSRTRSRRDLYSITAEYERTLDNVSQSLVQTQGAEAHCRYIKERFRQIIDTAHDGFVSIDAAGLIIEWNNRAEEIFGWARHEVIGLNLADTMIPPPLGEAHLKGIENFFATGQTSLLGRRVELSALHRDGHVFPVEVTIWPTSPGDGYSFNAFVRDITAPKLNREALGRLSALVQGSDDAIIDTTLEGDIVAWNRGAEMLFGYTTSEAVGNDISMLVPRDLHVELGNSLARVRRGERVPQHDTVWVTKSGVHVEVALNVSPIRQPDGTIVGISAVTRDVAEQRWMANTLDATLERLQAALEEAQQAEARSRRFLADAAHQLRTPVAGIRACADTLLRAPPPKQRDRLLGEMVNEASRAARLLTSLLRMARLDQGEPLILAPCDVGALCQDEAERARSAAPHLDISVETSHVAQLPELDANAIREILANLLDNSRRHALGRVDIRFGVGDEWAEVRVIDDGPGPPGAMADRLFERFVSLDGKGGSGLGLPIAKELARAHGGDLTYLSREEGFLLRLPLTEDAVVSPAADGQN